MLLTLWEIRCQFLPPQLAYHYAQNGPSWDLHPINCIVSFKPDRLTVSLIDDETTTVFECIDTYLHCYEGDGFLIDYSPSPSHNPPPSTALFSPSSTTTNHRLTLDSSILNSHAEIDPYFNLTKSPDPTSRRNSLMPPQVQTDPKTGYNKILHAKEEIPAEPQLAKLKDKRAHGQSTNRSHGPILDQPFSDLRRLSSNDIVDPASSLPRSSTWWDWQSTPAPAQGTRDFNLFEYPFLILELPSSNDNYAASPATEPPPLPAENRLPPPSLPVENLPSLPEENLPSLPEENLPSLPVENLPSLPEENLPSLPEENVPSPVENLPSPVENLLPLSQSVSAARVQSLLESRLLQSPQVLLFKIAQDDVECCRPLSCLLSPSLFGRLGWEARRRLSTHTLSDTSYSDICTQWSTAPVHATDRISQFCPIEKLRKGNEGILLIFNKSADRDLFVLLTLCLRRKSVGFYEAWALAIINAKKSLPTCQLDDQLFHCLSLALLSAPGSPPKCPSSLLNISTTPRLRQIPTNRLRTSTASPPPRFNLLARSASPSIIATL